MSQSDPDAAHDISWYCRLASSLMESVMAASVHGSRNDGNHRMILDSLQRYRYTQSVVSITEVVMYRFTVLCCIVVAAVVMAAPAPLPKPKKQDAASELKSMQGDWFMLRPNMT